MLRCGIVSRAIFSVLTVAIALFQALLEPTAAPTEISVSVPPAELLLDNVSRKRILFYRFCLHVKNRVAVCAAFLKRESYGTGPS
jgi:hypothetical protein